MIIIKEKQLNIRISADDWKYLVNNDNYSELIRELILDHRIKTKDPIFLKSKIEYHKEEIKKLEDLIKQYKSMEKQDLEKIQELLEFHAPGYQRNAPYRSEQQRLNFVKRSIYPDLKKHGFKGSLKEIDDLLINMNNGGK